MGTQTVLLAERLSLRIRSADVVLTTSALMWTGIEKDRKLSAGVSGTACWHTVQVCEIVAVCRKEEEAQEGPQKLNRRSKQHPYSFTVSFVKRRGQHQWICSHVTFDCADSGLCDLWVQVINQQLALLTNRPKSLLVYINPYSGKRQGRLIYEQKVAPVFRRAAISTDVIVTERANHARDHLTTEANLNKYDGVVCVGGDGMFSEILHGLMTRTQDDHEVDQNQPDAELVPCSLRIGIIPAGSTDCICFATTGTIDPVTSALHIIVGDSQPMDVCSVHHNNVFLRYCVSMLGYGFYGDVLTDSETKRWLGPARYDLSGIKTFLSHNFYEGTVSFLPAEENNGSPRDKLLCRSGCLVCQHKSAQKDKHSETSEEKEKPGTDTWHAICGKFIAINAANISCACPRSPKGLSPSAHLADGSTDLILVRECSRLDFFKHLVRHTNKEDQFDLSFVEVHRVRKFRFQPNHPSVVILEEQNQPPEEAGSPPLHGIQPIHQDDNASSCWNCDGEILPHTAIQVSVQCQLIRLFARGIEEQQQQMPQKKQQQQQQEMQEPILKEPCTLLALNPTTNS